MDDYERIRTLEAELHRAEIRIFDLENEVAKLKRRITDIEARAFANSCEREMELATWRDGIAASVGQDLEDVDRMLLEAMGYQDENGERRRLLTNAESNLMSVIGELYSYAPAEAE